MSALKCVLYQWAVPSLWVPSNYFRVEWSHFSELLFWLLNEINSRDFICSLTFHNSNYKLNKSEMSQWSRCLARGVQIRGEKWMLLCKLNEIVLLDCLMAEEHKIHAKDHICLPISWHKNAAVVNNVSVQK